VDSIIPQQLSCYYLIKMGISYKELISSFSTSLGVEKAKIVVDQAIINAGYERKDVYVREESLKICDMLGESDIGSVRIVSHALKGRCRMRKD